MSNDTNREAFEAWLAERDPRGFNPSAYFEHDYKWHGWQASRKQACDQVAAHFEQYTNPVAGHILAEQVREILK